MRSRVSRASSSTAAAWRTTAVCSGSTASSVARRRQAEPGARLLQRGLGLLDPELEVGRVEPRERLALADPRAQVDVDGLHAAGNFGLRVTCSSAARVPVTATVRGRARSAAGTTLTSRAGEPAAGA